MKLVINSIYNELFSKNHDMAAFRKTPKNLRSHQITLQCFVQFGIIRWAFGFIGF